MKNFFQEIKNSVYGPDFYRQLLERPFSYSFKYFAKLFLLIALLYSIIFSALAVPFLYKAADEAALFLEKNFPADLEIKVEKGIVSTSQESPYFYPTPEILKKTDDFKLENLFAIDTRQGIGADEFEQYNSLFLITRDSIIFQDEESKTTIQELGEETSLEINKKIAIQTAEKITPYLKSAIPFIIIFVFIFSYLFIGAFNLGYLLFGALFVWLVARVKKFQLSYSKAYQLGLHLLTLPLFIFALPFGSFPFAFTFLLVVAAAINLEEREELKNEPEKTEEIPSSNPNSQESNKDNSQK